MIVVCISFQLDLENTDVLSLAKEADPKGERTLAVLTKADQIEDGTFDSKMEALGNRQRPLQVCNSLLYLFSAL